jgi:serine phosphatase RsbU (regulator of sigma subunit)
MRDGAVAAGIVVLLGAVFVLDYATGHELRLFLLYFLPVSLAGWRLGRIGGLLTAAVSALAWTAADVMAGHEYGVPLHQVWNAAVQLLTFSFVAVLLARTSEGLRKERKLNAQLVDAVARAEELNAGLSREKARVERLNEVTRQDLELAARVQRAIVPPESPQIAGLDVAVTYRPAIQVGGDLLDIYQADEGRTLFFLGDAMGHGVHAALIMSAVSAVARRVVAAEPDPAAVLSELNRTILSDFPDHLVTGVCCLFEGARSTAILAVAGHPPPLWMQAVSKDVEEVGGRNPVLGMLPGIRYRTYEVQLSPGDALVFYTDGLIDAESPNRDHYGEDRLQAALSQAGAGAARHISSRILEDVLTFCEGVPLNDDLALLILRLPAE